MALNPGAKLGPYEIVSPIGAGGMGEVYKAKDTRLDRTVAIKVLPSHVASNPEVRQRFEREARAVSSLNHPHICTLYDIGSENGIDFMVMEYIEGDTLTDRLSKGALPLDQALRHGIEIADALDKAHRHGVVHRDLKPGNIMLTKSGAKLLDFGLAKMTAAETNAGGLSALPTEAKPLTQEGSILGTFQYMAPEQLEGKEADARTDIFAFGAVLYEMVTGKRAFEGKSQASLISAIMSSDPPPISELQPISPPLLDRIARRCLEKDPDERWQSAKDLTAELRWIGELDARAEAPRRADAQTGWSRKRWAWIVAAVAAIVALGLLAQQFMKPPGEKRALQFAIYPPEGATFSSWRRGKPAISPDGSLIAFSAKDSEGDRIWVRSLDSLDSQPLPGTQEGFDIFWSPDSRRIAFNHDVELRTVDVGGGPPQSLTERLHLGGTWNDSGDILFAPFYSPIHRVSSAGGASAPLTKLDPSRQEVAHTHPQFLPDGERFLFFVDSREEEYRGTYVASLRSPEPRRLVLSGLRATYAEPGYLLYVREGSLFAQRFDLDRLAVVGDPALLAESVGIVDETSLFSVSTNDVLAYKPHTADLELTWFDRRGNPLGTLQVPEGAQNPELSPDGDRVAFERPDPTTGNGDVWLYELSRGIASRFTFDSSNDSDPTWSPDGRSIIFSSSRDGYPSLYRTDADGQGKPEMIHQTPGVEEWPMSWSSDGQYVIYDIWSRETSGKLFLLSLSGNQESTPLLQTDFQELNGQFSPDGKWVSYVSNQTGRYEVYVSPFPPTGATRRISPDGGTDARWRGDGKEIFYLSLDRKLMAVELSASGTSLQPSSPKELFQTRIGGPIGFGVRFNYAVSSDGQRFLINTALSETRPAPIIVVLNWTALLEP